MPKEKSYSLRIQSDLLEKVHFVSEYDGRSVNSEILFLIRGYIRDFEAEHGEIKTSDLAESDKKKQK